MIRIEELRKALAGRPVLSGVSIEVPAGEVLAVVGASGTGKSVLLKHVIGLMQPDAGDVWIDDVSIGRADARGLARLRSRMGYVFQDAALLDSLTVRENLRLALDDDACRRNPMYATDRTLAALNTVNLDARALDRLPGELSGGMRKRIGVARALINRPDILLYDEPTTGLDPANVLAIHELVLQARDELGATSLVVTHDMQALTMIADRVLFLADGRVRFLGEPDAFLNSTDAVVQAFTGRAAHNRSEVHDGQLLPR